MGSGKEYVLLHTNADADVGEFFYRLFNEGPLDVGVIEEKAHRRFGFNPYGAVDKAIALNTLSQRGAEVFPIRGGKVDLSERIFNVRDLR